MINTLRIDVTALTTAENFEQFLQKRLDLVALAMAENNADLLHQISAIDKENISCLKSEKKRLKDCLDNVSKLQKYSFAV